MRKIKKYLSPSGSLPKPNLFQRPDGSYFYTNNGEVEVNVTPLNKLTDNPAEWIYTDETGRIYTPKKEYKNTYTLTESNPIADYHNYLNLKDKSSRDRTMAKAYLNNGNVYDAFMAYIGMRAPKNPFEITGEPSILPGRATPQLILLSAKLMETINKYWKNLGKLKIRLGGNGKYASGILTKPGTAPTTFNGQNINYITSPKGGNVTHKFYTDQGSEYILTKDGFARRVKSSHANTGGADAGLHEWNKGATRFLDSDELGWSYQAWTDRTKPLGFSEKDGIISLVTKDNGKWRYVMRSELRPNAIKNGTIKDGIILSAYTTEPKIGKWMLEYGTNPTGEINWFHPGSQVAFIEGLKQGGKMNTLLFLKNGSGIHIKKKNRGKFTDYCGGLVTQECINKGKHSSNPAVRKRATFADNARKWKHKNGGKAFVEGVNILDSNPKAYKYVKKKYKMRMALNGTKFDWTSTLANVGSSILQGYFKNKKALKEASASAETAKLNYKLEALSSLEETIKNKRTLRLNILNSIKNTADNPNAFGGVFEDTFIRLGDNEAISEYNQKIKNYNSTIDALLLAQESENTGNFISGIMLLGMGVLNNYLSNKSSLKNAPTTISTNTSYNYFSTPKKFGTFNNDGSMNLGYNMTWSTDKGILTKNWSDGIFNKSLTDYLK